MLVRKTVRGRVQPAHADRLPFKITNRPDAVGAEELEAANVDPGQENDRLAPVQTDGRHRREVVADVRLAGAQRLIQPARPVGTDVLHVGEALPSQEVFRHVLRGEAEALTMVHPKPRRLGRRFSGDRPRPDRPAARGKETANERASVDHPFSSLFSSLRNRQSVP
jgi:hypothetical protein